MKEHNNPEFKLGPYDKNAFISILSNESQTMRDKMATWTYSYLKPTQLTIMQQQPIVGLNHEVINNFLLFNTIIQKLFSQASCDWSKLCPTLAK